MIDRTHLESAETALGAANKNLTAGQADAANTTALIAIAHSLLAVRDQLYLLGLPEDQRPS